MAIQRIWQQEAEDYVPFNIGVTTERPASFNSRTAVALITRKTDAFGDPNPYNSAGGVACVKVFGTSYCANYRPAWIYQGTVTFAQPVYRDISIRWYRAGSMDPVNVWE